MADIIAGELKNLMYQLTKKTNKDKKIRGILLCKEKGGMIVASNVCIGDENKCDMQQEKCPDNTIEVGVFRSYPSTENTK